jgi:hypothetical protein
MYKEQNDLKTQTFRPLKRCNSYGNEKTSKLLQQ